MLQNQVLKSCKALTHCTLLLAARMCCRGCIQCKNFFFQILRSHHASSGAQIHVKEKKRDFAPSNFWREIKMSTYTLKNVQNTVRVLRIAIDTCKTTYMNSSCSIWVTNILCTDM